MDQTRILRAPYRQPAQHKGSRSEREPLLSGFTLLSNHLDVLNLAQSALRNPEVREALLQNRTGALQAFAACFLAVRNPGSRGHGSPRRNPDTKKPGRRMRLAPIRRSCRSRPGGFTSRQDLDLVWPPEKPPRADPVAAKVYWSPRVSNAVNGPSLRILRADGPRCTLAGLEACPRTAAIL